MGSGVDEIKISQPSVVSFGVSNDGKCPSSWTPIGVTGLNAKSNARIRKKVTKRLLAEVGVEK